MLQSIAVAKDPERREAWTGPATDYVLEHGLIGLSLRPLAKALGTSDRMLLYHFGTKDDLVAAVLLESNDRAVAAVAALPPSADVRSAVLDLWSVADSSRFAPVHAAVRRSGRARPVGPGALRHRRARGQRALAGARWSPT